MYEYDDSNDGNRKSISEVLAEMKSKSKGKSKVTPYMKYSILNQFGGKRTAKKYISEEFFNTETWFTADSGKNLTQKRIYITNACYVGSTLDGTMNWKIILKPDIRIHNFSS